MRLIILCLFFVIPTAYAADNGIFYILDEKFIDNISELPVSAGNPDKQIQTSGNIEGWIDIVGFNKMMRENGLDYVPGNPANHAIIQYDAKGTESGIFESIEKTISFTHSENNLTAILNVKLKWHTQYCDDKGCFINGPVPTLLSPRAMQIFIHSKILRPIMFSNNPHMD